MDGILLFFSLELYKLQIEIRVYSVKILVVRHGWREKFIPIQQGALGFEFGFALFPGAFAAPVFLEIKERDERGQRGQRD